MRLNGTNKIITEDDINLSGSSLSERFESQQKQINQLQSNVKWIYKYGGVGKGGSGGGSFTAFSIYATINEIQLKDQTIILNGTNSYRLYIKINNPNGASFNVQYKYTTLNGNGSISTQSNTKILSIENNYTIDTVITLNNNDTLTVIASDGNDTKQVSCNYITTPYTFDLVLANNNEVNYKNEEIFINTAATKGLKVQLHYQVYINASVQYEYTFNNQVVTGEITDKSGIVDFPIDADLFVPSNAGFYNASINLQIIPENQTTIIKQINKSFSLIPEDLYLLLQADTGNIYSKEESNPVLYKPGYISFNYRVYQGTNYNRDYNVAIYLNGVEVVNNEVQERVQYNFKIFANTKGKNILTVSINNYTYTANYYLYVDENTIQLDWLSKDWEYQYYYRINNVTEQFSPYRNQLYIQQTVNSQNIEIDNIKIPNTTGQSICNTHIAFGLQYNSINGDNPTILEFYNNQSSTPVLSLTQKTVTRGNNSQELYIQKQTDANANTVNNYHLIQIYSQFVKQIGNNTYYKLSMYIDGNLEAEMANLTNSPLLIESFKILPVNCFINCIDIDYKLASTNSNCDYEVYNYFLKYQNIVLGRSDVEDELNLLAPLSKFKVGNNGRVTVNQEIIDNIAKNINTPTLVFTHENSADEDIISWIEGLYGEDGTMPGNDKQFQVSLSWSPGRTGTKIINFPDSWLGAMFKMRLQGSSTKNNRGKNFFIEIVNADEGSERVYLFSPNFSKTNVTTFLPEFGFNLKADIVDSSHSNNTTCGKFVNTVCKKFNTNTDSKYAPYVRNCLEGFPILLYLQVVDKIGNETKSTFYYLGIYNFNLGRESYFNLGYRDLKVLEKGSLENAGDGFTFFEITKDEDVNKPGLGVAEIQGGSPYFDFSQYDQSILFEQSTSSSETKDITYMFGDLVRGSGTTETNLKDSITSLVRSVALSGGYLFDYLKKNRGSYADGYNAEKIVDGIATGESLNQVPDYTTQYKRTIEAGTGSVYTPTAGQEGTIQDLIELLIPDLDSGRKAKLDYQSLAEYYTICMVLGLVDSVMKNLNIKTWDLSTWFAAFYDMDSCLGLNNAGADIEYFAFSDYWHGSSKTIGNVDYPDKTFIYRDFSPKSLGANGYDIPSSFLFAVAKYARLLLNGEDYETWMSVYPQELYAKWRSNKINPDTNEGILKNADYFVDNFFSNNLGSICPALVSYNYRAKYLSLGTSESSIQYVTNDYQKFHGTRRNKVRDWLNGRLHILDVYFNLNKQMVGQISYLENDTWKTLKVGDTPVTDLTYKGIYSVSTNPDVTILHDILSEDDNSVGTQLSGNIAFTVKCPKNSPLQIYNANNTISYNYIIGGDNLQSIDLKTTGVQTVKFGGSQAWTYLQSINWINTTTLLINSDNLESINGNEGSFSSITLKTPNVKTIDLNSSKYSGLLTLNDFKSYPNLNSVNIANSKMSLNCDGLDLKTLNISNIVNVNSEITIRNCNKLEKFICSNATLKSLTIRPINQSLSFTNCNINSYNLSSKVEDASIVIENDTNVENVTLSGFKNITIKNCPKLRKVTIQKSEYATENISITYCNNAVLTVVTNDIDQEGVCDFTGIITLQTLTLENSQGIKALKLPNNVKLLEKACYKLIKLETIDGTNIQITGRYTFLDCNNYKLHDSKGNYTDLHAITDDLTGTFQKNNNNNLITIEDVKHFFNNCVPTSVTNISYIFYGNMGVSYTLEDFQSDLVNHTTKYINLSKFINIVTASCAFGRCNIRCYNKNMLNFGTSDLNLKGFIDPYPIDDNNVYVTMDSLVNIITKVSYVLGTYNNNRYRFNFLDNNGQPLTGTINLKDFFNPINELGVTLHPTRLISLSRFYLSSTQMFNLEGIFTSDWNSLTDVSEFLWMSNQQYTGTDQLFANIPKLSSLGYILIAPNNDEVVNLYTLLDWSAFLNRGGNISSGGYNYENFTIHKTIQLSDFLMLCNLLLKSSIRSIAHIFCNCDILGTTSELTFGTSTVVNNTIKDLSKAFQRCRMINNNKEIPIPFSPTFFKNFTSIQQVSYLFKDTYWSKPIPFNLFNKRIVNNNINRNVFVKIGDNYEPAILTEYIYTQDMIDFRFLFHNVRWTADSVYYQPQDTIPKNRVEKDGVTYDTYYVRVSHVTEDNEIYYTYTKHQITQSTEITDAQNLVGYYISQAELKSDGSWKPYPNTPVKSGAVNSLCIPPDLFYGANSLSSVYYDYALACATPLQGIIPENIFKANRSGSVSNTFLNQYIIPRLVATYKENGKNINAYTHFPRKYTENTNLDNAFNIDPIIPQNDNKNINWVFIILKDSIPQKVVSMDYAFRIPVRQQIWWYTQNKDDINYINYIGNITKVLDSYNISEGFDMQYFNQLKGDHLLYSQLNVFLHGHLFNTTFDLYDLSLSNYTNKVFNISLLDGNDISAFLIFPIASGNIQFFLDLNQSKTVKSSQIPSSSIQYYKNAGLTISDE